MEFTDIVIGMTGQQFTDTINGNFSLSKTQFQTLAANILKRVKSDDVKAIKVSAGKLYYTLDEENWISVDNNVWGSITGDINDQTDLIAIISTLATDADLETLATRVTSNTNAIEGINTAMTTMGNNISQNTAAIGALQTNIADKVSSATIKAFRISASGFLEYTANNVSWVPVESIASINWGAIGGEIANQEDLQTILNSKVKKSDFDNHKNNTSNPHMVTKEQVDLGNVDNTSDADKPISDAQQLEFDRIDTLIAQIEANKIAKTEDITGIEYISLTEYNQLKDEGALIDTVIYIVD